MRLFLTLSLLTLSPSPVQDPFDEARTLLSAEKPREAEESVLRGLAQDPYSQTGYRIALNAAALRDDTQAQLRWAKWLYWSDHYGGKPSAAESLGETLLHPLWANWNLDQAIVDQWRSQASAVARDAGRDKNYRISGHLFDRLLKLTPSDAKLTKELEKLEKKAGDQLSGGSFVAAKVRRKSPSWIRKQDEKHASWDNAFKRKTRHYEIITNISYEFFETVSVVMEDMFKFYQKIYDYNKKAPQVTLAIASKRGDFNRFNMEELGQSTPNGVLGWFYDKEMTVAAFMDTDDLDVTMDDLWRTLFHEASHQFMYLKTEKVTKTDPPTWLNEGTASYFEGCEMRADGTIIKNKPALLRVNEFDQIHNSGRAHTLKELVDCPHRNYSGDFYSYGWSLVYFLLNYEENDSRLTLEGDEIPELIEPGALVYRDAYYKYLDFYTKKPKKDGPTPYELAVQYFVDDINDPEIPDWEAFEKRWEAFTLALVAETRSGTELADRLQARCRGYLSIQDWERALNMAEQADQKRPNDSDTFLLLALSNAGADNTSEAAYWMLRHWELVFEQNDDTAMQAAEEWMREHDLESLADDYCVPTKSAFQNIGKAMDTAEENGQPAMAMLFGSHLMQASGLRPKNFRERIETLEVNSGTELRLWQRAYPSNSVTKRPGRIQEQGVDSILVNTPENRGTTWTAATGQNLSWLEPPYDVRGTVQVDGSKGARLLFGIGFNGRAQAAVEIRNGAALSLLESRADIVQTGGMTLQSWVWTEFERTKFPSAQEFDFEINMESHGGGQAHIGEKVSVRFPEHWQGETMSGKFGVGVPSDTAALFEKVEVKPRDPFWPVAPPAE